MKDDIPIKLDPGLVTQSSFKDAFQVNPESLSLFQILGRINHERSEQFLGLTEEELANEVMNEKIDEKLRRQREQMGDGSGKSDKERFVNVFEDVNEESLANITGDDGDQELIDNDQELEQEETEESLLKKLAIEKEKLSQFHKNKGELLKLLQSSLNEASLSLDFVSLLVTSVRPNVGKTSMSSHLKQFVPLGSLNSDRIGIDESATHGKLQNVEVNQKALVSWKIDSLTRIIEMVNQKSRNLVVEAGKEKRYFQDLHKLSITKSLNYENGNEKQYEEVLFKIGEREIGIKYGYQDSGSRYRLDRGVAALEKSKGTGELAFRHHKAGTATTIMNKIMVKIFEKIDGEFAMVSESKVNNNDDDDDDEVNENMETWQKVQWEIKRARNLVFEEELFYQLIKEAKVLLPYGAKIVSNRKISIELEDQLIEIIYVTIEKDGSENVKKDEKDKNDNNNDNNNLKADYVVNFLKLMLCHYHKTNVYETNNNGVVSGNLIPLLLRPLIGKFNHEHFMKRLIRHLIDLYRQEDVGYQPKVIDDQGKVIYSVPGFVTNVVEIKIGRDETRHQDVFKKVTTPSRSIIRMQFTGNGKEAEKQEVVELVVKTSSEKSYCDCLVNLKLAGVLDVNFSDVVEIGRCLKWVTTQYF
ncbi:Srb4 protein [Saccharomycopsis crataegensis]|uniref:Mediator of RNA polymerase II transcription subunit 17 n=1 Tax=Saccharomycopsis crataegensis TaxID=43959 RepID=A0AAV5QJZ6_9ASCO|nr:Srb4 protein [Saccharomycopsis crataegensis]